MFCVDCSFGVVRGVSPKSTLQVGLKTVGPRDREKRRVYIAVDRNTVLGSRKTSPAKIHWEEII
jgi:hypothetical protein